jgi:hypothetical protein
MGRVLGRHRIYTPPEMSTEPPPSASDTRGTVLIVAVFGVLVVVGWLGFFFGLFLPRQTP